MKTETFSVIIKAADGTDKTISVDGYAFDDRYAVVKEDNKWFILSTVAEKAFMRFYTSRQKAFEAIASNYDMYEANVEKQLLSTGKYSVLHA